MAVAVSVHITATAPETYKELTLETAHRHAFNLVFWVGDQDHSQPSSVESPSSGPGAGTAAGAVDAECAAHPPDALGSGFWALGSGPSYSPTANP